MAVFHYYNLCLLPSLQLSHITQFATTTNRENAWDNLVAIHHQSQVASSWSTQKLKRGSLIFKSQANVTAVTCSTCGNMAWVGDERNRGLKKFVSRKNANFMTYGM